MNCIHVPHYSVYEEVEEVQGPRLILKAWHAFDFGACCRNSMLMRATIAYICMYVMRQTTASCRSDSTTFPLAICWARGSGSPKSYQGTGRTNQTDPCIQSRQSKTLRS